MARGETRPFVDTNVLFSGFYNPRSTPGQILDAHVRAQIAIVISRQVLDELVRTVHTKRPSLLLPLRQFLTVTPPEICPDPSDEANELALALIHWKDAPILAAMIISGADCLVTGNSRHFTADVARQAGIRIVSPADYVSALMRRT
jgi:predicted nucleic acid-binding protein